MYSRWNNHNKYIYWIKMGELKGRMRYADHYQRAGQRNYTFYRHDACGACDNAASGKGGSVGKRNGGKRNDDIYGKYGTALWGERAVSFSRSLGTRVKGISKTGSYDDIRTYRRVVYAGLLAAVWGIAAAGMLIKALWINCPKWFSSVIYIAMGWVCVFVFGQLFETLSVEAFLWLLAGGIIYTVGGVIYALKLSIFNSRHVYFGSHEVFHLFVMAGSICHFIFMYRFVL